MTSYEFTVCPRKKWYSYTISVLRAHGRTLSAWLYVHACHHMVSSFQRSFRIVWTDWLTERAFFAGHRTGKLLEKFNAGPLVGRWESAHTNNTSDDRKEHLATIGSAEAASVIVCCGLVTLQIVYQHILSLIQHYMLIRLQSFLNRLQYNRAAAQRNKSFASSRTLYFFDRDLCCW